MKWEEKRYTPQELQRMQQEAVERVRQMQRRSEQAIRRSQGHSSNIHPRDSLLPTGLVFPFPRRGRAASRSSRCWTACTWTTTGCSSSPCSFCWPGKSPTTA